MGKDIKETYLHHFTNKAQASRSNYRSCKQISSNHLQKVQKEGNLFRDNTETVENKPRTQAVIKVRLAVQCKQRQCHHRLQRQ